MPQPEVTTLSPAEEHAYRRWLNASQILDAEESDAHYDYRGLFKELNGKTVQTSKDRHFPDTYKQHGHPTFSVESRYSKGATDGGRWEGNRYVAQPAEVLTDGELLSVADDPKLLSKLTSDERARLSKLSGSKSTANLDKLVASVPRDLRGLPAVSSNLPERQSGMTEMAEPFVNPQTWTDFGRILGLPVDSVRSAFTRAVAMAAARGPASSALSATGRGIEATGDALGKSTRNIGLADALFNQKPVRGVAIAVAPKVLKFAGRGLQRAGSALAPVVEDAATPVASVAAEAAQAAPAAKNALPNQKLLNELAIEARRAKVRLTDATEHAAIDAVQNGATPKEAVATVARPAASAPAASAAAAPVKFRLSAAESKEFARLTRAGKTPTEARDLIEMQRELMSKLGTPTPSAAETRFPKGMRGKVD